MDRPPPARLLLLRFDRSVFRCVLSSVPFSCVVPSFIQHVSQFSFSQRFCNSGTGHRVVLERRIVAVAPRS
eukprot:8459404-Pyramimonas_sp.AAC.1